MPWDSDDEKIKVTVRVSRAIWDEAKRCASAEESDVSWLVEAALRDVIPCLDRTRKVGDT